MQHPLSVPDPLSSISVDRFCMLNYKNVGFTGSVMTGESTLALLPFSHRSAFQNIRNFLAGRMMGATRDRALMDELFKCVFAKHWLLKDNSFAAAGDVSKSYRAAFAHV